MAQAVQQILDRQDLPPATGRVSADYAYARQIGASPCTARTSDTTADRLRLAVDGSDLLELPFDWSWESDDLRLFETRNPQGKHARWTDVEAASAL